MVIREFILQGIRRFREPIRFQLNEGLNVFFGGNEKGKTTIADALFFLLSVLRNKEQNESLRNDGAKEVRLGITFKDGPDNFRLLMDVISDAVLLSKYNQETKKFTTVSKDVEEIKEFFKRELLFKPLDVYKDIYLINSYNLIDSNIYGNSKIAEASEPFSLNNDSNASRGVIEDFEPSSFAGAEEIQPDNMTEEEIRSEIGKLEDDLKLATAAAEKQDKIEQFESELAEVQDKIKKINTRKTALQYVEKQVNELNKFSDLPDDIEKKIDDYIKFEGRIKKEIEDIERQRSRYESVSADMPPFYKDKLFIAGSGVVLLFIVAPILVSIFVGSWGMYLSAGIFVGLGVMGYTLWKDAGKRGEVKNRHETIAKLEKQIKEQKNKYEIEGSVIKSIISSMKLDSPDALKDGIKRYREVLEEFAKAKRDYNASGTDSDQEILQKQADKIKSDIQAVQEQIRTMSVAGVDPYSISQQIENLKNRLNNVGKKQLEQKIKPAEQIKHTVEPKKLERISIPPFMKSIETIAEVIGDSKNRIISLIGSRASSHFQTLTNGKFQEILVVDNRIVPITDSGKEIEFDNLSGSVKEKGMLSIILSIMELVVEKWPWPVIIDDPFVSLDDANRATVYGMIKNISKETQVVFLTKDNNLKPFADTFIPL
jgi:DNA repair exonuclease SbcCD ATPase subunit